MNATVNKEWLCGVLEENRALKKALGAQVDLVCEYKEQLESREGIILELLETVERMAKHEF